MADRVPGGEGSRSCDSPESTPRSLVAALARDDNQLHSSGTEGVIPRSVPWPRDIGGTPESKSRSFALLRCSGRQKNKSSGGQRVVILRPEPWPRDLGLEGVRTKGRSLAPFGDVPRSLRSLGTTSKKVKADPSSLRSFGMTSNCRSLGTTTKGACSGRKNVVCHPEAGGMAEGSRP
jgi:hypothetical protein